MKFNFKYINSEELIAKWNCDEHDLVEHIKINNLKAFHFIPDSEHPKNAEIKPITDEMKKLPDFDIYYYMESEFLLFREEDVLEFESKYSTDPASQKSGESKPSHSNVFPCPSGTKWEDIKITLIDNETVKIKTPTGTGRFTYHELGLSDKRTNQPRKRLWPMLIFFAKKQGAISRGDIEYDPKLTDTAKRLNTHLKDLFKIKESIYKGHYKKLKGYHTRIFFSDQTCAG